jgi:enoyl-CoA hydratase/carnithine racemase
MAVNVTVDAHVLRIELDRPEVRNALDWESFERVSAAWQRLATDDELWIGVVTATGDRIFCAGADLSSVPGEIARRRETGEQPALPPMAFNTTFCPKPVVCAMNGDALGGGLELAMACDFRIAADHVRFGLPEVRFGGIPGAGGTQRLPRLIGVPRALDLLTTGRVIDAAEARDIGLVNRVVPTADLVDATESMVASLLAVGPLAVWGAKEAVHRGMERTLEDGLVLEQAVVARLMASDDFQAGIAAYRAKQQPDWKAR